MRVVSRLVLGLLFAGLATPALAQPARQAGKDRQAEKKKSEADFVKEKPTIGDTLPDLTVYSPDGKEVKLSSLRGQHVVLTFGCLT